MQKIEIVRFDADHAREIFERNKKDGLKVLCDNVDEESVISIWDSGNASYTLLLDEMPICCSGIVDLGWNRGEAWTLISSLFFRHRKTAFKAIGRMLQFLAKEKKLQRVQAIINESLKAREIWMKHLGFKCETPDGMKNFGPNGETFFMYSRVF